MRITRIDVEGTQGRFATAIRQGDTITVTILTPELPNGRVHQVDPSCREDIFSMADCLHTQLEGFSGTQTDVSPYFTALTTLAE